MTDDMKTGTAERLQKVQRTAEKMKAIKALLSSLNVTVEARQAVKDGFITNEVYFIDNEQYPEPSPEDQSPV